MLPETKFRTVTELRRHLRERFGARHYRLTKTGEVHIYGTMPNSNQVGWYFAGYDNEWLVAA